MAARFSASRTSHFGRVRLAHQQRRPIINPSGTRGGLAEAIKIVTRSMVIALSKSTSPRSSQDNLGPR